MTANTSSWPLDFEQYAQQTGSVFAERDALRARVAKLEAALKEARPYVQGLYDAVKYGDGHIPKLVLNAIDDALKDAPR